MNISRRDFLKISTATAAGTFASTLGLPRAFAQAGHPDGHPDGQLFHNRGYKFKMSGTHAPSICPFCSVGCGIGIYTGGEGKDEVVHVEGDPDNPINGCPELRYTRGDWMGGSLCPKAQHIYYIAQREEKLNPKRVTKVLHRRPNGSGWEKLEFKDALPMLVERIKATRDATFKRDDEAGVTVNRCEGIGFLGGSATNNEPNYAFSKLLRALGCVYVDNEARDSCAPAIKAMRETFGRPGMTNTIPDIKNANQVLIVGANPAADQPVIMRWVFEAQDNSAANIVVVDPRVSRTAAKATVHVRIRPGTDLALIGGMINYILTDPDKPYNEDYVIRHTDATFLLDRGFLTAADRKGVFSGYDAQSRSYDKTTWKYRLNRDGSPRQDKQVLEPRAVLNVLRKHFGRYKPALVSRICGVTTSELNDLYKMYSTTSRKGEAGVILFGRGVMSQVTGTQTVRALAILQLLLGNIGIAGGGLVPLLTSSNTQGACDLGLLAEYLPGYLEMPLSTDRDFDTYLKRVTPVSPDPTSHNERKNHKVHMVNLLRAFFGKAAKKSNDWNFGMLPKLDPGVDYTTGGMFEAMAAGTLKGLIVLGENPAIGANGAARRKGMSKLDWLVVYDVFESDTAAFWKSQEGHGCATEVFFFPAPTVAEVDGTLTNMSRWLQWQHHALSGSEEDRNRQQAIWLLADAQDAKKDAQDRVIEGAGLITGLKQAYESGGVFPEPINSLAWDEGQTDPEVMMYEISGSRVDTPTVTLLKGPQELAVDGSTRCGCWLYAGVAAQKDLKRRNDYRSTDRSGIGLFPHFAWSWPNNVRIMYNRASLGKDGIAYDSARAPVLFVQGLWTRKDVLDGPDKGPKDIRAFTASPVGAGKLFAEGMVDGPFPEFYEPVESRVQNALSPGHQISPVVRLRSIDAIAAYDTKESKEEYRVLGLTYSLSEHHGLGQVTRYSRGAREIIPAFFIEVGADLAKEKSISTGDMVRVKSPRFPEGITGRALVTNRLNAIRIRKDNLHMIAIPENFGFVGGPRGAPAHDLTVLSGDPNTGTAACRTFLCSVSKA